MSTISINEPIAVDVLFNHPRIRPRSFIHQGRHIEIEQVNMVHRVPTGDHFRWIFSISNQNAAYRLSFDPTTLCWYLLDVYSP